MGEVSIRVENIGKEYRIGDLQDNKSIAKRDYFDFIKKPLGRIKSIIQNQSPEYSDQSIWALKNVTFDVRKGEVLGIIGKNGAGKSTLLKIMSGITYPTTGRVLLNGRIASLLEVGTGFNIELTGRENVYLNGSILGMTKTEIDSRFDEIIDFSGVEKYLDTPVKRYSSGMRVRLGFAVAAHLETDILLVDEVLAVGDLAFQKKCLGKMDDVASSGRTVLFVSHTMETIMGLCPRTLWINDGVLHADGDTKEVIEQYMQNSISITNSNILADRKDRQGNGDIFFTEVSFRNEDKTYTNVISSGEQLEIVLKVHSKVKRTNTLTFEIKIKDSYGRSILELSPRLIGKDFNDINDENSVVCHIPKVQLLPKSYSVDLRLYSNNLLEDKIDDVAKLEVVDGDFYGTGHRLPKNSVFMQDHSWYKE